MESPEKNPHEHAVEEYLDQLCAQLDTLPAERQNDIRRELGQHLQTLATRSHLDRASNASALGELVNEFGDPTFIGQQLALQWKRSLRTKLTPEQFISRCLVCTLFSGSTLFSSWLMLEMCRMFGWGHNLFAYFVIGPLIPLLAGFYWGVRDLHGLNKRWGYLLITLLSLSASSFLPVPGHISAFAAEFSNHGLLLLPRFGHLLLWLWIACSLCGAVVAISDIKSLKPQTT